MVPRAAGAHNVPGRAERDPIVQAGNRGPLLTDEAPAPPTSPSIPTNVRSTDQAPKFTATEKQTRHGTRLPMFELTRAASRANCPDWSRDADGP